MYVGSLLFEEEFNGLNGFMEIDNIYNMDCLEGMKQIPDGTIDMVVTSPPYNFGGFDRNGRKSGYATYSDDLEDSEYKAWIKKVLTECARVLKPGGTIYWNHKGRFENHEYKHCFWVIDLCPIQLAQHIIWNYPSSPDVAKIKWYPRHEEIFMFTKGTASYFNEEAAAIGDVWQISHVDPTNDHPAPFPIGLARRCVYGSCPEGGTVLDPFMGSGTTAIACIKERRHFIGFELSKEYFDKAVRRIKAEQAQLTLF